MDQKSTRTKVSEGRRKVIKSFGAACIGLGAGVSTVNGKQSIGDLARTKPNAPQVTSSRSGGYFVNDQPASNTNASNDATSKLDISIYNWGMSWVPKGFYAGYLDQLSSMSTYALNSYNSPLDMIGYSTVGLSWDSAGGSRINENEPSTDLPTIGSHPASGGGGDYTFVDAAITTGHNNLLDLVAQGALGWIYTPTKLVGEMVADWYDHQESGGYVEREFDYSNVSAASNWSTYHAEIEPSEL